MDAQRRPLCRGLCPGPAVLGGMCNTAPNGSLLADLAKQRDLPFYRAPPVEALRVGAGCGTGGQGSEEIAGCRSESVGGGFLHDAPCLGRGDDIGDAINVGDDHRGAAGHAFEQDIGPAFVRRDEQQQVGSAVDLRKAILWQMTDQAYTVGDAALAGERLDRGALGPFADDDKINPWEAHERFDHHAMTLQADEIANRQNCWPGQAERASRRVAIGRSEEREIDPVAQHAHAFLNDPKSHQPPFQPSRHRNQSVRPPCRPVNPPAWSGIFRDDVEIAAAGGDDDRATEGASEQHCGDAVRIEIMRVDQIEVPPPAELSAQNRQKSGKNGQGATTLAPTTPLSTNFRRRVSTKIPCWGRTWLGYNVVKVRICNCMAKKT